MVVEPGTLAAVDSGRSQLPCIDPDTCRDRRAVVIYHSPCADGLASLWAACHLLKQRGFAVHAIPMNYGTKDRPRPIPIEDIRRIRPENIWVLDFSFTPDQIKKFCNEYANESLHNIFLLDHHKTAIEAWVSSDGMHSMADVVNNDKRGCSAAFASQLFFQTGGHSVSFIYPKDEKELAGSGLTWKFMVNNQKPCPSALQLINDRDLWKLSDDAIALHAYIQAYLSEPDQWPVFGSMMESDELTAQAISSGTQLVRARREIVQSAVASSIKYGYMLGKVDERQVIWRYALVDVPFCLASETAEYVRQYCKGKGQRIDFVVAWYTSNDGTVKLSFRSEDASYADVSKIADLFGGGGHRNASGASQVSMGKFADHFLRHIERDSTAEFQRIQHLMVPNWKSYCDWAAKYASLPEVEHSYQALTDLDDLVCSQAQRVYLEAFSAPHVLGCQGQRPN